MPRRITPRMLKKARKKIIKDKLSGINADEMNQEERKKQSRIPKWAIVGKIRNEPKAVIGTKIARALALERIREWQIKQASRATQPTVRAMAETIDFMRTRPVRGLRKKQRQKAERISRIQAQILGVTERENIKWKKISERAKRN